MTVYWIYLVVFILSVLSVLLLTPVVQYFALTFNRLDAPSERKIHQQPVVRLGGVAIFCGVLISILSLWYARGLSYLSPGEIETVALLLLGGSGFFLVGFADDLLDLSAFTRLGMQCAIASILWFCDVRVDLPGLLAVDFVLLDWVSLPVTVLWLAGVVNAINWVDGLDGLATGIAGIAAVVLFLMSVAMGQPSCALMSVALLGSLLGFLYHNAYPASIFMGDGGSYFVGFMLASLCLVGPLRIDNADCFVLLLPLVILALPIGDMVCVILARLFHRQSPFVADNRHLHHRLLRLGLTHKSAVSVVYGLTIATSSLAFVLLDLVGRWVFVSELVALSALAGWLWWTSLVADRSEVVGGETVWFLEN